MCQALALTINNGFLAEEIIEYCHRWEIKYGLSYEPNRTWVFKFGNSTDLEIVKGHFDVRSSNI